MAELPLRNLNLSADEGERDMCALNYLHEAAVLHNLRLRFFAGRPYTYTGDICIAVNPYRWLAELYRDDARDAYTAALATLAPGAEGAADAAAARAELAPHVCVISAFCSSAARPRAGRAAARLSLSRADDA